VGIDREEELLIEDWIGRASGGVALKKKQTDKPTNASI
jgi:hypothetical protein